MNHEMTEQELVERICEVVGAQEFLSVRMQVELALSIVKQHYELIPKGTGIVRRG